MTLLTHPYRRLLAVVVTVAVVLDQGTKALIRGDMALHSRVPVIPGVLDFVHAENPGAAWGLMRTAEHRMVIFTFITLAAFALLLGWHRRLKPNQPVLAVALSLLVGGAAGNFLDRLMYRSVTDFIEPYIGGPLGDALLRLRMADAVPRLQHRRYGHHLGDGVVLAPCPRDPTATGRGCRGCS